MLRNHLGTPRACESVFLTTCRIATALYRIEIFARHIEASTQSSFTTEAISIAFITALAAWVTSIRNHCYTMLRSATSPTHFAVVMSQLQRPFGSIIDIATYVCKCLPSASVQPTKVALICSRCPFGATDMACCICSFPSRGALLDHLYHHRGVALELFLAAARPLLLAATRWAFFGDSVSGQLLGIRHSNGSSRSDSSSEIVCKNGGMVMDTSIIPASAS